MAQLGADVEQLDLLSRKFDEEAQKIEATISVIGSQVHGTWWQGPDAERFRNQWETADTSTEVFLTLRDRLRVFSSRIGGCAVVVVWSC